MQLPKNVWALSSKPAGPLSVWGPTPRTISPGRPANASSAMTGKSRTGDESARLAGASVPNAGLAGGGVSGVTSSAANASRGIAHLPPATDQHGRCQPGMPKQFTKIGGVRLVLRNDGITHREYAISLAPIAIQQDEAFAAITEPM